MGVGDKLLEALATVIKMNDKIVTLTSQVEAQQRKIEDLSARVVRLETALEIALASRSSRRLDKR